jgi:hypothetical protein
VIGRRTLWFALGLLGVLAAVAFYVAHGLPEGARVAALFLRPGQAPRSVSAAFFVIWPVIGYAFLIPIFILARWIWFARRPVLPEHRRYHEVYLVVMSLLIVADELFCIAYVKGWVGDDGRTTFLRGFFVLLGVVLVVFGNRAPKLPNPFKGAQAEPYDWTKLNRLYGWVCVAGGAAMATCAAVLPLSHAIAVILPVVVGVAGAGGVLWAAFKWAGRPSAKA